MRFKFLGRRHNCGSRFTAPGMFKRLDSWLYIDLRIREFTLTRASRCPKVCSKKKIYIYIFEGILQKPQICDGRNGSKEMEASAPKDLVALEGCIDRPGLMI